MLPALLALADIDAPKVKITLPAVRQGDHLQLKFKLDRVKGGRAEVLLVQGVFRVVTVVLLEDLRQELVVEALGTTPSWRAVRKKHTPARKVGPTRFPKTVVT